MSHFNVPSFVVWDRPNKNRSTCILRGELNVYTTYICKILSRGKAGKAHPWRLYYSLLATVIKAWTVSSSYLEWSTSATYVCQPGSHGKLNITSEQTGRKLCPTNEKMAVAKWTVTIRRIWLWGTRQFVIVYYFEFLFYFFFGVFNPIISARPFIHSGTNRSNKLGTR